MGFQDALAYQWLYMLCITASQLKFCFGARAADFLRLSISQTEESGSF